MALKGDDAFRSSERRDAFPPSLRAISDATDAPWQSSQATWESWVGWRARLLLLQLSATISSDRSIPYALSYM